MSRVCPSSSHQLVAAAFRRAREKFPTNFGQLSDYWSVKRPVSGKSVVPNPPMPTTRTTTTTTMTGRRKCLCKNCEKKFSCNCQVRDWSVLSETARVTGSPPRRVCPCRRRIRGPSKKRNLAVSFGETMCGGACGGDEGRKRPHRRRHRYQQRSPPIVTTSRKIVLDEATSEYSSIENDNKKKGEARREGTPERCSSGADDTSESCNKIDNLDLLYERGDPSRNRRYLSSGQYSTSALSRRESLESSNEYNAPRTDHGSTRREYVDKWHARSRRSGSVRRQARSVASRSSYRSRDDKNRLWENRSALVEYSRDSSSPGSSSPHRNDETAGPRCAIINHKDSMAILVEKFKKKKIGSSCEDSSSRPSTETIRFYQTKIRASPTKKHETRDSGHCSAIDKI